MLLQQYTRNIKTPVVVSTLNALPCIEIYEVDFREKIFTHKRPWCIYTLLQSQ